jgi:hypothetical protein
MECQAILKSGKQCSRKAEPDSLYCWQHQNYVPKATNVVPKATNIAPKIKSPRNLPQPVNIPKPIIKANSPRNIQQSTNIIPQNIPKPVTITKSAKNKLVNLIPEARIVPNLPTTNSDNFNIFLNFETVTEGKKSYPIVELQFVNGVYAPFENGYINLESNAVFHLIKRASDRLAINTTNSLFEQNHTFLNSISAGVFIKNEYNSVEVIALDEVRQYTNAEKVKATLKGGAATLLAPLNVAKNVAIGAVAGTLAGGAVGGAIGGVVGKKGLGAPGAIVGGAVGGALGAGYYGVVGTLGGAVGGIKGAYQKILGDEYLNDKNKKLFKDRRTYLTHDREYYGADVPFNFVIHDLVFPKTLTTGETYTLYIEGIFMDVLVGSQLNKVTHADTSSMVITKAEILSNSENKSEVKRLLKLAKSNPEFIYFEAEI